MVPWPLPLAAFEEYMLLDDFPEHPMCFFARLRFDRRLTSPAVSSGLSDALARHPLLAARVQGKPGRWQWTPHPEPPAIVEHDSPDDSQYPPARPIDLFASSGVRLWLQHIGEQSNLVVQFHHACTDGLGALAFLDDLLVGVAHASNDADPTAAVSRPVRQRSSRSLDPTLLRNRGRFGLTAWSLLKLLPGLTKGLVGASQFFGRKASPLAAPRADALSRAETPFPTACSIEFTLDETERHRQAAADARATVNDALIRDLHLACGEWRNARGLGSPTDWMRVCVPINLRTHADARTPAANIVTMVFIDAPQGDAPRGDANADRERAAIVLADVASRMETIKKNRLGLILPLLLALLKRLPGGMKPMIQSDDCRATAVLTNVGVPLARCPLPRDAGRIVVGQALLEGFDLLAPIRRHTAAAFAVWKYAGRLNATCHFDSRVLTSSDAHALLDQFASRIRNPLA